MRFRKETNAKKTIRKWLALVLVVAIVASSGIYALDHALQAHDGEGEYSEDIGEASALQEIDLGEPEDTESAVPEVTETESSVPEVEDSETDAPEGAEPVNSEPGQPEDEEGENVEPEENEGKPQNNRNTQNLRAPPGRPTRPGQSTPTPRPTNYTYYFRNDTTSAGVTIYYSKNGSTDLIPIANGQRIGFSGSEIKGIMFYVKVEEGYELEKISFPTGNQVGEFSNIGSTGSLAGVSFGNANRAAQNMGCIKEFHYSEFNPSSHAGVDLVRSFKVNAKTIGGQSTEVTRIIYHSNDGRNATKGQSVDQNSNATLLGDGAFERDGYTLIGWSTEADDTAEYGLGASYQVGTKEVDLYAVWQEASQPTPTPTADPTSSPDPEDGGSPTPTPTVGPTSSPGTEEGGSPTPTATATPTPTPTPTPVPEPKDITVTIYENGYYVEDAAYAGNHTYVYDGTDKTASGYVWTASDESYTKDDFKYIGDASKLTVTAKEEGTYAMELTAADFENTNTAGFNVTFVIVDGGFEISKTKVVLTAANATKVYDGAPLTADGVTAQGLPEDYTVEATMTAGSTITNVGEVLNTIESYVIKNAEGADVTSTYSVTTQPGLLKITKRPVTLTSPTASKQYDGNPLTAPAVTISGSFVSTDVLSYRATGKVTYPSEGKVPNPIRITWVDESKKANYQITENVGTLEITNKVNKYAITLTANSGTYLYDGNEKTVSGFVTDTFVVNRNTYQVENITATASATDVKKDDEANLLSYPVTPVEGSGGLKVYHVKDGNKVDVTDQFDVTVVSGALTITPRHVLMESANAVDVYDAEYRDGTKVLKAETVDDTAVSSFFDGFVEGEGAEYHTFAQLSEVGAVPNIFEYTLNSNTKDVNYEITVSYGELRLTSSQDQIIVYIAGNTDSFTYDGSLKTVSGYEVTQIVDLNDSGYSEADFELKENVEAEVSATDAGSYDMGLSTDSFTNINTNYADVVFVVKDGKLVIDPVSVVVTITGNSDEFKYNGSEQSVTGYETEVSLASYSESNIAFDGTAEAVGTDAGTYEMGLTADDFSNTNGNYTVQFVVIDGELDIARREVTLTSDSASRVFNGQPLSAPNVTVGGDGFVDGEGVTYSGFPTLTPVGQISNTFNWEFIEDINSENYIVNAYYGTLTVTPVPVPVVDDEELYTLTIYYVNDEGEQVALPYIEELPEGAQFSIASPVIEGYTPDIATVSSTGMPARNVTITVTYTPVDGGDPEDPEDPDDPAGPVDPDDPDDPADPADPDDPAIPAIPAVAPDEPAEPVVEPELPELPEDEPADIMIVADEEGEPELVVIEDEETPLAGGLLEALHSCCILHFLILLVAMLVLAWYTKDMKKRQAKIFELKEQLEGDIEVE